MPGKHKIIVVSIDLLSYLLSRAAGVLVQFVIYRYNRIYLSPAGLLACSICDLQIQLYYSSPAAGVLVESKDTIVFI